MPPANQEYCFLWIDHWSTCMQKSEWASWVQAIFSVIAICAAIGIALWQRRAERVTSTQLELTKAEIVGAKVLIMTAGVAVRLRPLGHQIRSIPEAPNPIESLERVQAEFAFMPMPDEAQLLSLLPMPQEAARRLTHASELIDQSRLAIGMFIQDGRRINLRDMREQFNALSDVIDRAVELVETSTKDMRTFLNGRSAAWAQH